MTSLECYVAGGLATMLRVSRLGGIAPLKFVKKGSGWSVSLSPGWTYYGYFIVTVIILTAVGSLAIELVLQQKQTMHIDINTRRAVWIFDLGCMLVIAGTSVYGAPAQMRSMIAYMNRIEKIKLKLNIRGWPDHNQKMYTWFSFFWITVTVILTTWDLMLVIDDVKMNQNSIWVLMKHSTSYFYFWILQLRVLNFVIITLHVMCCFRSVNDSLKSLLKELADRDELLLISHITNNTYKDIKTKLFRVNANIQDLRKPHSDIQETTDHNETVRRLALAYVKTCDVVQDLNTAHGLIVLMILGSSLLHLVCSPFYFIHCIMNHNSWETIWTMNTIYVGLHLAWCFYHVVNLLMIIEPCHLMKIEMESTCVLVSHLMLCTESLLDPLGVELELFFKHLVLNRAFITAMHVTTISRTLVVTMFGCITTYLAIIIRL